MPESSPRRFDDSANTHTPMTPREIVSELDRYIVGQRAAKRAVAIALRNRWRRQQVPEELRDEIAPKNIIMIGPTGVGKTEISRRLAKLAQAPFLKVEASKFTEVGYVGRDVESMIRDLAELAVSMVKEEEKEKVQIRARELAEERVLDILLPPRQQLGIRPGGAGESERTDDSGATREKLRRMLREGRLDDRTVDVEITATGSSMQILTPQGMEEIESNLKDLFSNLMPKRTRKRRVRIPEALDLLQQEEAGRLIDMENVAEEARRRVQQAGIIFIDEIDKIAGRREGVHGPDVSREGVQRDLLPIVEGSTVNTKYGMVRTDHILFIASGAFHVAKPSDLIPEFQGRFPIRVELEPLTKDDFVRILTEPKNALVKQYTELMRTEGVTLDIRPDGIEEIARIAAAVNERTENIGARRLHTVLERLFDEVSFAAPEMGGQKVTIDDAYVRSRLDPILQDEDLSRYIL